MTSVSNLSDIFLPPHMAKNNGDGTAGPLKRTCYKERSPVSICWANNILAIQGINFDFDTLKEYQDNLENRFT